MKKVRILLFAATLLLVSAFNISIVTLDWGPEVALACNGGGCCPCNLTPRIDDCGFLWLGAEVVCTVGTGQCCPLACQY